MSVGSSQAKKKAESSTIATFRIIVNLLFIKSSSELGVNVKKLVGDETGRVKEIVTVEVRWEKNERGASGTGDAHLRRLRFRVRVADAFRRPG